MDSLIDEAWRMYRASEDNDVVVKPSIPILFFGDSGRYFRSPLKVVTVALNPSGKEFPEHDRFQRFRPAEGVNPHQLDDRSRDRYLAALDGYFRDRPYHAWFVWFDEVLRGMGASYYDGEGSGALHTDLCSPLATDPTWSGLGDRRARLGQDGFALWHRLVERLEPDVIVVSVARHYRDRIAFARPDGWQPLHSIPRKAAEKRPYIAWTQGAILPTGKSTCLVFGPAAQQPFATLGKDQRRDIGRAVRRHLDGR